MKDFKQILLHVGNKLVADHSFNKQNKNTGPLVNFLLWLDRTPEAVEALELMGYSFSRTSEIVRRNFDKNAIDKGS